MTDLLNVLLAEDSFHEISYAGASALTGMLISGKTDYTWTSDR
jgi:hypothetical protein